MKDYETRKRRIVASLLTTFFLMQQSMVIPAMATQIGGGADGWVTGNGNVYDIDPTSYNKANGGIGFRKYEQFDLSEGDIANLIYKYGSRNIETFINLVDGKVNINGIVNSMRDGKFYNGKAVFVSPSGMVVGASGVLNVGSLGVYTPAQADYNALKNHPDANWETHLTKGSGTVEINGKVFTQGATEINAGAVSVGQNAGIMAGLDGKGAEQITTASRANALFNELVNTNNITSANTLTTQDGKILITAYNDNGDGVDIKGNVKNFGSGEVTIENTGKGGVKIASVGKVSGNGLVNINNTGAGGTNVQGTVVGRGVNVNNKNSNVVVGGNQNDDFITSYGDININIENGDLVGAGDGVKTHLVTNEGGNLNIEVVNGKIGDANVGGACVGDACVGVGPDARVLSKSVNTRENIENAFDIIKNIRPDAVRIGIATSNFHVFRGMFLAKKITGLLV